MQEFGSKDAAKLMPFNLTFIVNFQWINARFKKLQARPVTYLINLWLMSVTSDVCRHVLKSDIVIWTWAPAAIGYWPVESLAVFKQLGSSRIFCLKVGKWFLANFK